MINHIGHGKRNKSFIKKEAIFYSDFGRVKCLPLFLILQFYMVY